MYAQHKTSRNTGLSSLSLLCVVLVLFVGIVQAVHVHSGNSKLPSHECSVCSVAHAGILHKTAAKPIPIFVRTELVSVAVVTHTSSVVLSTFRIRPPPSV